jgi:hypothetical protein
MLGDDPVNDLDSLKVGEICILLIIDNDKELYFYAIGIVVYYRYRKYCKFFVMLDSKNWKNELPLPTYTTNREIIHNYRYIDKIGTGTGSYLLVSLLSLRLKYRYIRGLSGSAETSAFRRHQCVI